MFLCLSDSYLLSSVSSSLKDNANSSADLGLFAFLTLTNASHLKLESEAQLSIEVMICENGQIL
jgi:hypothetical protein